MSEGQIVPYTQKVKAVRDLLERSKAQIAMALPKHIKPERMLRVAMTAIQQSPKLLDCEPLSLVASIVQASQLGLEVGVLGQAYLVPFKNSKTNRLEAQLIIGYRGLISLARRSGEIETLDAHVVHERDVFRLSYGTEGKLIHEPCMDGDPGKSKGAYAYARLKGGGYAYDYMAEAELEKVRASSKSSGEGPWVSWTDEMKRKTIAKRLCKWLPLSVEMEDALEHENRVEAGLPIIPPDGIIDLMPEPETKMEALTKALATETLNGVKEAMQESLAPTPEPPKLKPSECAHTDCPPSRIDALPYGKTAICTDCGQEFRSTAAAPAQAGQVKGRQSRLPEE